MADVVKKALSEAKAKLHRLVRERNRLDQQIAEWERVVNSLAVVTEKASEKLPPDVEATFTAGYLAPSQGKSDPDCTVTSPAFRLTFTDAIPPDSLYPTFRLRSGHT